MYEKYTKIPAIIAIASLFSQISLFFISFNNDGKLLEFPLIYRGRDIYSCNKIVDSVLHANMYAFGEIRLIIILIALATIFLTFFIFRRLFAFVMLFNCISIVPFGLLGDRNYYIISIYSIDRMCESLLRSMPSVLNIPILSLCLYIITGNLFLLINKWRSNLG